MLIRLNDVFLGFLEVVADEVQTLPLLDCHLLRLQHHCLDVRDLAVNLRERLLFLPQQPALNLIVEAVFVLLLLA
jgi:hypothetical protein